MTSLLPAQSYDNLPTAVGPEDYRAQQYLRTARRARRSPAKTDNKSITETVGRVLRLGFYDEQRLGGPTLHSLFLAATDIARSQAYAAGLSEEEFVAAKWAKDPRLVDRIADSFAGLVRMLCEPDPDATEQEG